MYNLGQEGISNEIEKKRDWTMTPYDPIVEQKMKEFYETLSEKDKRRYAGIEAMKLGRGSVTYINRILGCSQKTITKGLKELAALSEEKQDKRKKNA